jgi:putative nucleotidyltransferase with HDIG domain
MSVPSREQAAAILRDLAPNEKLLNHSAAVAEVCAFLCAAMTHRGVAVDAQLAEGAALLHDLDKALPAGDKYRALGHGAGGAAWLRDHDLGELAEAVASHPVWTLGNADSYETWAAGTSLEARLVAYADKRALQDLVSLDARFERWQRRYPDSLMEPVAYERAKRLERELCDLAGVEPAKVARLPWVDEALRQVA